MDWLAGVRVRKGLVFASQMVAKSAPKPMQVCRSGHFVVAGVLAVERESSNPETALAELAPMSALLAAREETVAQGWETAVFDSSVAAFAWQHPAEAISAFGCRPTSLAAPAGPFASAGHLKA